MSKIVTRLSLVMTKRRVIQWDLANHCEVSQAKISLICSGTDKTPSSDLMKKIADFLKFEGDPMTLLDDMSDIV